MAGGSGQSQKPDFDWCFKNAEDSEESQKDVKINIDQNTSVHPGSSATLHQLKVSTQVSVLRFAPFDPSKFVSKRFFTFKIADDHKTVENVTRIEVPASARKVFSMMDYNLPAQTKNASSQAWGVVMSMSFPSQVLHRIHIFCNSSQFSSINEIQWDNSQLPYRPVPSSNVVILSSDEKEDDKQVANKRRKHDEELKFEADRQQEKLQQENQILQQKLKQTEEALQKAKEDHARELERTHQHYERKITEIKLEAAAMELLHGNEKVVETLTLAVVDGNHFTAEDMFPYLHGKEHFGVPLSNKSEMYHQIQSIFNKEIYDTKMLPPFTTFETQCSIEEININTNFALFERWKAGLQTEITKLMFDNHELTRQKAINLGTTWGWHSTEWENVERIFKQGLHGAKYGCRFTFGRYEYFRTLGGLIGSAQDAYGPTDTKFFILTAIVKKKQDNVSHISYFSGATHPQGVYGPVWGQSGDYQVWGDILTVDSEQTFPVAVLTVTKKPDPGGAAGGSRR